jgi:hypothetical protein
MSGNISVHEMTSNDLKWIVENSDMPADFIKAAEYEYERRVTLIEESNNVWNYKSQV